MNRAIAAGAFSTLSVVLSLNAVAAQDNLAIWREFVRRLKTDTLTVDRIKPVSPLTPESQLAQLKNFIGNAAWEEWDVAPEVVRHANLVSFIITLGRKSNSPWTYTFNFVVENDRWYFRFQEGIVLRLDKVTSFPASGADFPDLPEERKAWIRQELYWSKMVRLFNEMAAIKGKDQALNIFRDGAGYALMASVWVPFYPTPRAFILYLCWEQAKVEGNKVTLENLTEREATVRFDDIQFFALYMQTTHLRTQISLEDYIRIFETIWQNRASAAGWTLKIDGQGRQIFLRFSRQ